MIEEYKPTPRKQVTVRDDISFKFDYVKLHEAVQVMRNLAKMYPGGSLEYGDYDRYESRYGLYLVTYRDETDLEMTRRHDREREAFARQQQRDAVEFDRLKKKFEK